MSCTSGSTKAVQGVGCLAKEALTMRIEDGPSFGQWVKQRRQALGLTQKELAAQAHCSVETVRKIEADERRPSRAVAETLGVGLQITPAEQPAFLQFSREGGPSGAPINLPPLPGVVAASSAAAAAPPVPVA